MRLKGKKIGILIESDCCEQEIWYYHYRRSPPLHRRRDQAASRDPLVNVDTMSRSGPDAGVVPEDPLTRRGRFEETAAPRIGYAGSEAS